MPQNHRYRQNAVSWVFTVLFACIVSQSFSQTFNSGSTGVDGALNLTTQGTVLFDPSALGLHPAVPNVFNFTTINIAGGTTVKLSSNLVPGPVYWLASGAVTINGTITLDGENGQPGTTSPTATRIPAIGGPGGYSGGVGGAFDSPTPPEPGNGPGGGPAATGSSGSGSLSSKGSAGQFIGSLFLIPLIGGSGGGGGTFVCEGITLGSGGGGGAGAILIASSVSITGNSAIISAQGGQAGSNVQSFCGNYSAGGGGSGGAIRLIAPNISFSASLNLNVAGGFGGSGLSVGSSGRTRVEAFTVSTGTIVGFGAAAIYSVPFAVLAPTTPPATIVVASINGVAINANPFSFPDTTINSSSPVTINVQARYIPIGTIPKIVVMSESGADQTVNCSALQGTLAESSCSASISFPTGGSRGFVKATWQ